MSASIDPGYPDELKVAGWEKDKKSGFDAKSDLADKLKALHKRHDAVDWKLFADGWAKAAKTAADLQAESAKRDKAYGASVLPLKKDALAVASLAKAAEKKADKALLATLKSIGKVAETYASALDKGAATLKEAYEKAQDALPEEEDDEDSAPSALLSPKLLLKQLTQCRNDPERQAKFAFVDAKDKQPALLAMHPRMGARALFGKLQAAAGVKTGAYGTAWVDGTSLMLQLDKPLSGLVKKVRAPVKACGFKIAKVVLWTEDGQMFEQDDQDESGDAKPGDATAPSATQTAQTAQAPTPPTPTPSAQPAQPAGNSVDPAVSFKARLSAAVAGIQAAIQAGGANAAAIRLKFGQMGVLAKKPDYPGAHTVLDEIEDLMAGPQAPTAAQAAPAATASAGPQAAQVDALRAQLQDDFDALQRGPLDPKLRERFQPFATGWAAAQEATAKGQHERALMVLQKIASAGMLAKLRQAMAAGPGAAAPGAGGAKAAPSQVALQSARLVWDGLRKSVQSQFSSIEQAVMAAVRTHNADPEMEDEFDEAEIASKLQALFQSLDTMDQGLLDKLDEALNAEGAQRDARFAEAAVLVQQFRSFAAGDATLAFIDDNGFASTNIRVEVDKALAELSEQI